MNETTLRWFPPATALALAILLLFHPAFDGGVYDGLRGDVGPWLVVHVGLAILAGLLAAAAFVLLRGFHGRAVTVSRVALGVFVVFFIAWEATLGIGTGILVDQANGLPAAARAPVADVIQICFESSVLLALSAVGNTAWVVAIAAAAVAFRQAGGGRAVTLLIVASSLFVLHDAGPDGAIGLTCFAAAAILAQRPQARRGHAPAAAADGSAATGPAIASAPETT